MNNRQDWTRARDELNMSLHKLGFPSELGDAIAKQLGWPKAWGVFNIARANKIWEA